MKSSHHSNSDSDKSCPQGYSRALSRPPKSKPYLDKDDSARKYEKRKWADLLEKAREKRVCIGCDFCGLEAQGSTRFLAFEDSADVLLNDTLVVKAVTVVSTGNTRCWRVSASLADRFWLSETSVEYAINALFPFARIWIKNLATIRNLMLETNIFGQRMFLFDLLPPARCPFCSPPLNRQEIGGLLPTTAPPHPSASGSGA